MLGLAVLLAAAPAAGAVTVQSFRPDHISLTVYRAPGRTARQAMDLRWLAGFALVTETRTIDLPAGDAVLRFEGVADGIVPASAVVTDLAGGVIEKNRDTRLLSPAALIDGTLGRYVTLRRTDKTSGAVREQQAKIVAGPSEGVVLETESGIETLGCSGLRESPHYEILPAGLSTRAVLSVVTHSPQPVHATVTLSYLANGFDWSASYVATVAPGGGSLDLSAWLTLANGNAESFADVDLQAVAGRLQRAYVREIEAATSKLELHCYPLGTTTSDLPVITPYQRANQGSEIIVTARRTEAPMALMAPPSPPAPPPPPPPEDLGDLKLYRVPKTVTVSANGQKQVALLARRHVAFDKIYRVHFQSLANVDDVPAAITLRLHNDDKAGLGIPLPAGTTTLYQPREGTRLLLGTGTIGDTAKGEHTLLMAGVSPQVRASQNGDGRDREIVLSNANPFPVPIEVAIGTAGETLFKDATAPLERVDGIQTWRLTLPANGKAQLDYSIAGR